MFEALAHEWRGALEASLLKVNGSRRKAKYAPADLSTNGFHRYGYYWLHKGRTRTAQISCGTLQQ
jgi:hypothetical protein